MEVSGHFRTRPLNPRGKSPQYPFYRGLGGPHSPSGRCGLEKKSLPLPGIEPRQTNPQLVAVPTELSRLYGTVYCLVIESVLK
jgi:hypothetical protein